jgi:hypothetical protein
LLPYQSKNASSPPVNIEKISIENLNWEH